jgi:hypothetical protein
MLKLLKNNSNKGLLIFLFINILFVPLSSAQVLDYELNFNKEKLSAKKIQSARIDFTDLDENQRTEIYYFDKAGNMIALEFYMNDSLERIDSFITSGSGKAILSNSKSDLKMESFELLYDSLNLLSQKKFYQKNQLLYTYIYKYDSNRNLIQSRKMDTLDRILQEANYFYDSTGKLQCVNYTGMPFSKIEYIVEKRKLSEIYWKDSLNILYSKIYFYKCNRLLKKINKSAAGYKIYSEKRFYYRFGLIRSVYDPVLNNRLKIKYSRY